MTDGEDYREPIGSVLRLLLLSCDTILREKDLSSFPEQSKILGNLKEIVMRELHKHNKINEGGEEIAHTE